MRSILLSAAECAIDEIAECDALDQEARIEMLHEVSDQATSLIDVLETEQTVEQRCDALDMLEEDQPWDRYRGEN